MLQKGNEYLALSALPYITSRILKIKNTGTLIDIIRSGRGAFMFGLGYSELLIVSLLIIILFGSSKLPQLGQSLGEAIRGF